MRRLGAGVDNVAYLVGDLVVRFRRTDPAEVAREARLLRVVGAVSPVPVPVPEFVDPVGGCLAYRMLPGVPLLSVTDRDPGALGARLGRLLAALHAVASPDPSEASWSIDDAPPREWLDEALSLWPEVEAEVPQAWRGTVRAFLRAPAPEPAASLAFSHQDLGAEHVLVDPGTGEITGVVDWSDAAVGDPARDLGLILRDLGPVAFAAAVREVAPDLRGPGTAERAHFYARCGLIADLEYGISTAQPAYREKSIAALDRLFTPIRS
ncbi:aminoglycoside phosphotransferase family protein [Actinoplanes sp. NPDC049118]|uniref:phosphotransferase family protein n=1 Tax=Actinoplanes sp. NPDC049118 TaxID=3155769 RepID=UPI0033FC1072